MISKVFYATFYESATDSPDKYRGVAKFGIAHGSGP